MDDSTFKAYRNNPRFLSSILPLSGELDAILSRIFECDPRKRIGIPELRDLILRCPRFTTHSSGALPPTPPSEPQYMPETLVNVVPGVVQPIDQCSAVPTAPVYQQSEYSIAVQLSTSSQSSSVSDSRSTFSAISYSSSSSCGSLEEIPKVQEFAHAPPPPQPTLQYFRNYFPMDPITGPIMPQPFLATVQVC